MPDDDPQLSFLGLPPAPVTHAASPSRDARRRGVQPCADRLALPAALADVQPRLGLGTSSWSFPGWSNLVWDGDFSESQLARKGLAAYAAHPLLSAVGIDRGFYAPLGLTQYLDYASQVPEGFRFLVKAPDLVTGAVVRDEHGRATQANAAHLDAAIAEDQFVGPCREGLGAKAGALVFQFSPLPRPWLNDTSAWIERLGEFLARLPVGPRYAIEIRDRELLTPRLMRTLAQTGATYCLGVHDRLPPVERQLHALDALEQAQGRRGPLVVRWSLHAGRAYQAARERYAPFDRLIDEDPVTRNALAQRAADVLTAGQEVLIIANNKAEGCAPRTVQKLAAVLAGLRAGGSRA